MRDQNKEKEDYVNRQKKDPETKGYLITHTFLKSDELLYHTQDNYGICEKDLLNSLEEIKKLIINENDRDKCNTQLNNKEYDYNIEKNNREGQWFDENNPLKIILAHGRCPGDILPITCLVRDIKKQYGNKILLKVDTPNCPDIWYNNPYLTSFNTLDANFIIGCDYGKYGTQKSNSWQYHFYHAFRMHFEEETSLKVEPRSCYPEIYLTDEEKIKTPEIEALGNYWLIWPGNKSDCKIKTWVEDYWYRVLEYFRDKTFVQIGQSKHNHKYLDRSNVINYIDKTNNHRDLFKLMYHAQGSIGYISYQCHLAAAFQKPAIVLAGAREPLTFIKYNNQTVLSTMGCVPCGDKKGCWGGQVKGKKYHFKEVKDICANPMVNVPLCMWLITPEMVINAIEAYDKGKQYAKIYNYDKFRGEQEKKADGIILNDNINDNNSDVTNNNKSISEMVNIKLLDNKPIFKIVANACAYGGGEKTAVSIIKLMIEAGYKVELVPSYRGNVCPPFLEALPKENIEIKRWRHIKEPCDIFLLHCNDLIWDFSDYREDRYKYFPEIKAKRKIMSVNFAIGEIGRAKWTREFDLYICQRSELLNRIKEKIPNANCVRLHPPADLQKFFDYNYTNRPYDQLRLIRHSSQGNKKYFNNMDEIVDNILAVRKDCRILLMPAPTYLSDMQMFDTGSKLCGRPKVQKYIYDAMPVESYLNRGNLFWYFVDERKFIESGCNAVLEALASGLPVLCNNNGGLVDIVNNDIGWVCSDFEQMYEIIKNVTLEELKEKGNTARDYAKKTFDKYKWVKHITNDIDNKCVGNNCVLEPKKIDIENNNKIKVSFVMGTYQRYDLIHRAIKSVIKQTDSSWELLVFSDGEDAEKRLIIDQYRYIYPDKIKYYELQHRGCWGNYIVHDSIDYCNGEFIFYLDDDDEASPFLVQEMYDYNYDAIWHRVKFMRDKVFWGIGEEDYAKQRMGRPSMMIRKSVLQKCKKHMMENVRFKSMDMRVYEFMKNNPELKIRLKRLNKCYVIAHKNNSQNLFGLDGFKIGSDFIY